MSAVSERTREIYQVDEARLNCLRAIEHRFGWLKQQVAIQGGSIEELKPHEKQLWYARESIVGTFNRVGQIRDAKRKIRGYEKLQAECSRLTPPTRRRS